MPDVLERLRAALADRYAIEREIGSGGMATVYLAEDLKHHRNVAIKVLRPDLAATLGPERFLREIEVAAQLQHPHIMPLHDSGEADGFLFYVMPYVEGQSLRDKLAKEGELPIGEAVRILRDIVDALTEAHANGVVHRDIKPENILLRGRHALVTDFGVAKAVSEATGRAKLTTAGVAIGTPAYMAPEQASADPHLDHRVDIYSVGAVAYELLTGRPVFMGTSPQQVLAAHMTETPPPVTRYRDTVPPALEQLVMRCLEKKPADRFQTAEELLPRLDALTTPSGGMTPTVTRPLPGIVGGRRWRVQGVVAAAAVLIAVGFGVSRLFRRGPITVTTSNARAVTSEPGVEWFPALSPDGDEVAFVAQRDGGPSIVIRSTHSGAESGELRPTQGMHHGGEFFPAWSPDGESVRFRACPGAWSTWAACPWTETGKMGGSIRATQLPGNAEWLAWSPDGSRVAFTAGGDSIFTYSRADGTTTLLAVHHGSGDYFSAAWSPNGRRLAFVHGNWPSLALFQVGTESTWIVAANGGEPVPVTSEGSTNISPAWLDDEHLLFVSDRDGPREVYVVDVGPTGPRGPPRKVLGVTDAYAISYSVAGRRLAFSKAGVVRQNVWSYPLDSGTVSIRDGHPMTRENAVIEAHDISRDGRWLAYSSPVAGTQDVYTRPLAGGNPTLIAGSPLGEYDPRWSPDGTEIAFHARGATGDWMLMVVPATGGTPTELARAPWTWQPSWSPSGLALAFNSNQSGRIETWVVSRETIGGPWSEATQLTDFGCWPSDWAPDGRGVLCQVMASREIFLVSLEGEVLWRYDPSTTGLAPLGTYLRFSRDGSITYTLARHQGGSAGIWSIPMTGGAPRRVIAFDDPELFAGEWLTVGSDRLYLSVQQAEMDIWVADVEVER